MKFILITALSLFSFTFTYSQKSKTSEEFESFKPAFKEFDAKNGYKGLKFGNLKSIIKSKIKLSETDRPREFSLLDRKYKSWFDISFDSIRLIFNKNNQLYQVSLSKTVFENYEYDKFINELISLFGKPNILKEKNEDDIYKTEYTKWCGKNFCLSILYFDDKNIFVDFYCNKLDDSLETDKLY
jgi:hypothetical protein